MCVCEDETERQLRRRLSKTQRRMKKKEMVVCVCVCGGGGGLSHICMTGSKGCWSTTCSPVLSKVPVASIKVLSRGLSSSHSILPL